MLSVEQWQDAGSCQGEKYLARAIALLEAASATVDAALQKPLRQQAHFRDCELRNVLGKELDHLQETVNRFVRRCQKLELETKDSLCEVLETHVRESMRI